jgi:hypothetical protein
MDDRRKLFEARRDRARQNESQFPARLDHRRLVIGHQSCVSGHAGSPAGQKSSYAYTHCSNFPAAFASKANTADPVLTVLPVRSDSANEFGES